MVYTGRDWYEGEDHKFALDVLSMEHSRGQVGTQRICTCRTQESFGLEY